jgi:hypothetical protein
MGIDIGCAVAVPPLHQKRAVSFVDIGRHFQHGRPVLPEDRQQAAGVGYDRLAV